MSNATTSAMIATLADSNPTAAGWTGNQFTYTPGQSNGPIAMVHLAGNNSAEIQLNDFLVTKGSTIYFSANQASYGVLYLNISPMLS